MATQPDLFRSPAAADRALGRVLRDQGGEAAVFNEAAGWKIRFKALANAFFAGLRSGALFTGEDVRVYCILQGLPEPHHQNVWSAAFRGWVLRKAREPRGISPAGFRQAQDPAAHARVVRVYRKHAV